jgi:hypothetical protein
MSYFLDELVSDEIITQYLKVSFNTKLSLKFV